MIDSEVIADLQSSIPQSTYTGVLLKLLEAYCHLTEVNLTKQVMASEAFQEIVKGFLGALADNFFFGVEAASRTRLAKFFYLGLVNLARQKGTVCCIGEKDWYPRLHFSVWQAQKHNINPDTVRYWNGWEIKTSKGKSAYLAIPVVWNSFGKIFAEEIFTNYKRNFEKLARPGTAAMNKLLEFVCNPNNKWSAASFKCPIEIRKLFTSFMIKWFEDATKNKYDLYSQIKNYSKFIYFLNEAFIVNGVWAKPFLGELPTPRARNSAHRSNIRTDDQGELYIEKLITPIPLHITDAAAIEILFHRINQDVLLLKFWARSKVFRLRKAQRVRDKLAKQGSPIRFEKYTKDKIDNISPSDLASTLEQYGLKYLREEITKSRIKNRIRKETAAKHLALPSFEDLLAFKLLLIHSDQRITEASLNELELYDKNGVLSGFLPTDTGYQLVTYKDRRGADRSQIKIDLSPRSAVLIRQLIDITAPLRKELSADDNDDSRLLFLHTPRSLAYPSTLRHNQVHFRHQPAALDRFLDSLSEHSSRSREELKSVAIRTSASTYRPSCAVANYLLHKDTKMLAQALGHSEYQPNLLRRYLPDPILDFLQSRWIKIFQKGIICLAFKESDNLLRASKFNSLEELHNFLTNHALAEIPEHLIGTATHAPKAKQDKTAILVSVSPPILKTLLAVEEAVNIYPSTWGKSGIAKYWAEFARLLTIEIENCWDADLKNFLLTAKYNYTGVDLTNVFDNSKVSN